MSKKLKNSEQSTISSKGRDLTKSKNLEERKWAENQIKAYGEDNPWVRVTVFGEPDVEAHKPIKKKKINGCKKGKQFERDIANQLGHIFPDAERMLEFQSSNNIGVDIQNTDRIKIQCKRNQVYCPIGKINEIRSKDPDAIPVLVTKGNNMDAMAVLPFAKLVTLLEIAYGLELPFRTFDIEPVKLPYVEARALPMTHDCSALLDDLI